MLCREKCTENAKIPPNVALVEDGTLVKLPTNRKQGDSLGPLPNESLFELFEQ